MKVIHFRSACWSSAAAIVALLCTSCGSTQLIPPVPPTVQHPEYKERIEALDEKLAELEDREVESSSH